MIIRKDHATAQAGYAHTRDGANGVMYSLGAVISKTLAKEGAFYDGQKQPAHNWLGAFKLPDGMWAYFAVRDANFLPSGDFAGSKEEVLDRLHGDYGLGGWNVVVGDAELEDYGFHNFNSKTIEELIPHKKTVKSVSIIGGSCSNWIVKFPKIYTHQYCCDVRIAFSRINRLQTVSKKAAGRTSKNSG